MRDLSTPFPDFCILPLLGLPELIDPVARGIDNSHLITQPPPEEMLLQKFLMKMITDYEQKFLSLFFHRFFEHKIANIFLRSRFNICFGCSEEPSH